MKPLLFAAALLMVSACASTVTTKGVASRSQGQRFDHLVDDDGSILATVDHRSGDIEFGTSCERRAFPRLLEIVGTCQAQLQACLRPPAPTPEKKAEPEKNAEKKK